MPAWLRVYAPPAPRSSRPFAAIAAVCDTLPVLDRVTVPPAVSAPFNAMSPLATSVSALPTIRPEVSIAKLPLLVNVRFANPAPRRFDDPLKSVVTESVPLPPKIPVPDSASVPTFSVPSMAAVPLLESGTLTVAVVPLATTSESRLRLVNDPVPLMTVPLDRVVAPAF